MPNLARARERVAEATLTDTCTIVSDPKGYYDDTLNLTSGELEPAPTTVIYQGACSFRAFTGGGAQIEVGAQQLARLRYRLTLPWAGSQAVQPGQTVTCDSCSDASLVGRTYIIQHVTEGAWEPSRRCDVEDRVSGEQQL